MCIETGRRHHEALQSGNEYAKHDQPFLELSWLPCSLRRASIALCCSAILSLACSLHQASIVSRLSAVLACLVVSVQANLASNSSAVSVPSSLAVLALSCSLHRASIVSCPSAVLALSCSLRLSNPSFPLLSCFSSPHPSSVLFCLPGKPNFLLFAVHD